MNVDAEFRSLPAHLFGGIPTQVANKRTAQQADRRWGGHLPRLRQFWLPQ